MKIETYKCDVCKDVIKPEDLFGMQITLQEVNRKTTGLRQLYGRKEFHVCRSCGEKMAPEIFKTFGQSVQAPDLGDQLVDFISEIVIDCMENNG